MAPRLIARLIDTRRSVIRYWTFRVSRPRNSQPLVGHVAVPVRQLHVQQRDVRLRFAQRVGPGRSFVPVLNSERTGANRPVVVLDEYRPTLVIRNHSAKYIYRYPDGPDEFYDLEAGPGEITNEIDHPALQRTIEGMRAELQG